MINFVAVSEIVTICLNRNCCMHVIQVGVRCEIEIPGCSRIVSDILDSICKYLTFNIVSFPPTVCECMASHIYSRVEMSSSLQR